jgi:hypothetical protein
MRLETLETSDRFHIFPVFFSAILNQNSKKLEFLEVGGGNNPIFLHFLKCNNKLLRLIHCTISFFSAWKIICLLYILEKK